jgi:hypothetical protein
MPNARIQCVLGIGHWALVIDILSNRLLPADAERVRDSIDVVEPRGNERDLEDAAVIEANRAQPVVERRRDAGRVPRDLLNVLEHPTVLVGERSGSVVALQRVHERYVQRDPAQKLCVRVQSILAPVHGRDDGGDHFVLTSGEWQVWGHQCAEGRERVIHRLGDQRV